MRKCYQTILVLGSGATKIGQNGEFDYSGSQALKVLKSKGIRTILLNPNVATVQTAGLADRTYLLPLDAQNATAIIQKEKPDGILLSFGGQTALNLGVELADSGVLEKYGVDVLGTPIETIKMTEDRERFKEELKKIGVDTPKSTICSSEETALAAADFLGYPVMVRTEYSLGGAGSGKCSNPTELRALLVKAFATSGHVLVEEYLEGWYEFEYEVVRDSSGACILACSMENFDPLGVHTGDSIVVAPAQTLLVEQASLLSDLAKKVVDHLGVLGECNIQFALKPLTTTYRVIEVNARLSRSSALASKAVGYPLAKVACRIALGETLGNMKSEIVGGATSMLEEPSPKYVVVKMPRFDFLKFDSVDRTLGSEMRAVGEAMAIGSTFEEALQKAVRMIEIGFDGLTEVEWTTEQIKTPTDRRLFHLYSAALSLSIDELARLSGVHPYFINKLRGVLECARGLKTFPLNDVEEMTRCKKLGFSDRQIASIKGVSEAEVRNERYKFGVIPIAKRVDPYGGKYQVVHDYMYFTYHGEYESYIDSLMATLLLGSGTYRIGSSVEFDSCCVSAAKAIMRTGKPVAIINCNPETVSTDIDEVNRLYFEELTTERIFDISEFEGSGNVVVSFGGQTPNNLCKSLSEAGLNVLGTSIESINTAEDRTKFSALLDELMIPQPEWAKFTCEVEAKRFAAEIGYPVLVRPSFVLSGAAMRVAYDEESLCRVLNNALTTVTLQRKNFYKEVYDRPVVISKFYPRVREVDVDGVAKDGEVIFIALSAHIERAGTHSGDASLVFPTPTEMISSEASDLCKKTAARLAKKLRITGPFNIQFLVDGAMVMVIELNIRASRSMPFVSRVAKVDLAGAAMSCMIEEDPIEMEYGPIDLGKGDGPFGCKAAQFSFSRLRGADPISGVEMASTGEAGCVANNLDDAIVAAFEAVGMKPPNTGLDAILVSSGELSDKLVLHDILLKALLKGKKIYATKGTYDDLHYGNQNLFMVGYSGPEALLELISKKEVSLVVNIPKNNDEDELWDDFIIRRAAIEKGIPLITNGVLAHRLLSLWMEDCPPRNSEPMALEDFRQRGDPIHKVQKLLDAAEKIYIGIDRAEGVVHR